MELIEKGEAFGRARVALRSFNTHSEALNFFNYLNTYIAKYAFLMTGDALTSLGKLVPDLENYKNDNNIINFSEELDEQLFKLLKLTKEEKSYVIDIITNLR